MNIGSFSAWRGENLENGVVIAVGLLNLDVVSSISLSLQSLNGGLQRCRRTLKVLLDAETVLDELLLLHLVGQNILDPGDLVLAICRVGLEKLANRGLVESHTSTDLCVGQTGVLETGCSRNIACLLLGTSDAVQSTVLGGAHAPGLGNIDLGHALSLELVSLGEEALGGLIWILTRSPRVATRVALGPVVFEDIGGHQFSSVLISSMSLSNQTILSMIWAMSSGLGLSTRISSFW